MRNVMLNISYCSDKYQYTMGKSFYENGMKDKIAVFNLFFRKAPDNNNWAVVSGTREAMQMVAGLGSEDIDFFEQFLPGEEYREFREYLAHMKFTGQVYAMKEGEIVFPKEPVITVVGPIIEAQVLETPLLCIMNHQMAFVAMAIWWFMMQSSGVSSTWASMIGPTIVRMGCFGKAISPSFIA